MLLEHVAQKIINNTMDIIGYPLTITDEHGFIIGASDPKRLRTFHKASVDVLRAKKAISYEAEAAGKMENVLPGVAIPILFNDEPIGVLGIIGVPSEVEKYAQLVKSHVELMIQESFKTEMNLLEYRTTEIFIHHILNSSDDSDWKYISELGKMLGFDLHKNRICMLFNIDIVGSKQLLTWTKTDNDFTFKTFQKNLTDDLKYYFIDNRQDIIALLNLDQFIILKTVKPNEDPINFLNKMKQNLTRFNQYVSPRHQFSAVLSIGSVQSGIAGIKKSYDDSLNALLAGRNSKQPSSVYYYNDFSINMELLTMGLDPYVKSRIVGNVEAFITHDKYPVLAETFLAYCKSSMNLSETARKLFLHRNSLVYRLEKICELTLLDLSDFEHCLMLYFAIKTQQETASSSKVAAYPKENSTLTKRKLL